MLLLRSRNYIEFDPFEFRSSPVLYKTSLNPQNLRNIIKKVAKISIIRQFCKGSAHGWRTVRVNAQRHKGRLMHG